MGDARPRRLWAKQETLRSEGFVADWPWGEPQAENPKSPKLRTEPNPKPQTRMLVCLFLSFVCLFVCFLCLCYVCLFV